MTVWDREDKELFIREQIINLIDKMIDKDETLFFF